jgi:hypothetical protein
MVFMLCMTPEDAAASRTRAFRILLSYSLSARFLSAWSNLIRSG